MTTPPSSTAPTYTGRLKCDAPSVILVCLLWPVGPHSLPPSFSLHVRTCRAHRPAGNRAREGVKSCHGRTGFTLNRHHGSPLGCRLAFRDKDTVLHTFLPVLTSKIPACAGVCTLLVVDCPIQLTHVTWICQLCSTTNTSEKYERTQQGNLLPHV